MRFIFLIWLMFLYAPHGWSQSIDPSDLKQLKSQEAEAKKKADALKKQQDDIRAQISAYKKDLKSTSAEVATLEIEHSNIDAQLSDLNQDATQLRASLTQKKSSLMETLAALQRVEMTPPPATIIASQSLSDSVITANLIGSVSQQLSDRSEDIKLRLVELEGVKVEIEDKQTQLSKSERALAIKQNKIKSAVVEKTKLDGRLGASRAREKERAKQLARQARDLQELISRFEKTAAAVTPRLKPSIKDSGASPRSQPRGRSVSKPLKLPNGSKRFADAKNSLIAPVTGRLKTAYGGGRKGYTVTTRPGAQVLSPFEGRVEFAGTFKTYGEVVILNMGENYFILLTGLGEVFVSSGEMVDASEPIGLMPFKAQNASELYIEFRKSGRTINPGPWLGRAY